jgi:aspartyl-tRNA(Asn)/glutamyl-tRNA(Gln) amidotransferase subunit B
VSASEYEPVIGLEVHCRLKTASKLFSPCPLRPGAEANAATDPYTWGLPGTLPTVNAGAVALAVRLAAALGCEIAEESGWDRKHYFYPDLPKGYQITQRHRPLARGGALEVPDPAAGPWATRSVALQRIHLEEDAAKVHAGALIDYNRAGAPLVEIVTAPVIRSAAEAARVLRALRVVLVRLGVSDATMEDGSLRCDVNVSLQRRGSAAPGT